MLLLIELAQRLKDSLRREGDTISRLVGMNLSCYCPARMKLAERVAEKLLRTVSQAYNWAVRIEYFDPRLVSRFIPKMVKI